MSLNLCFDVVGGAGMVEFPFQTTTALTRKVINEPDREERIAILSEYVRSTFEDQGWAEEVIAEIRALMSNPNLRLSYL